MEIYLLLRDQCQRGRDLMRLGMPLPSTSPAVILANPAYEQASTAATTPPVASPSSTTPGE